MGYNVKSIRRYFKEKGIFYTDTKLAKYLKEFINDDVKEVYDPTCGDGALLSVFGDDVEKFGQEIDPHQLEVAKNRLVNFTGYAGDTLTAPAFMDRKFDAIVANPPFSLKWEPPIELDVRFSSAPAVPIKSKADFAFILHILYMLSDCGTAAVLNFPGVLYRGQKEKIIREWIIRNNWIEKVVHIEGGYFEDTSICTALIIFKKDKTTTDIEFIDHENDLRRTVSISEIESNDYNLSVNNYIHKEEEKKEEINPIELTNDIHKLILGNLKRSLDAEVFMSELQGYEMEPLLLALRKLIKSYMRQPFENKIESKQYSLFDDNVESK